MCWNVKATKLQYQSSTRPVVFYRVSNKQQGQEFSWWCPLLSLPPKQRDKRSLLMWIRFRSVLHPWVINLPKQECEPNFPDAVSVISQTSLTGTVVFVPVRLLCHLWGLDMSFRRTVEMTYALCLGVCFKDPLQTCIKTCTNRLLSNVCLCLMELNRCFYNTSQDSHVHSHIGQ